MKYVYRRFVSYAIACHKEGCGKIKITNVEGGDADITFDNDQIRPAPYHHGLLRLAPMKYRLHPVITAAIQRLEYYTLDDLVQIWGVLPLKLKLSVRRFFWKENYPA